MAPDDGVSETSLQWTVTTTIIQGVGTYHALSPARDDGAALNVFTRRDGTIRHFWSQEMGFETADPGQDPRGAPDFMPIWTVLDATPEGRGADWYPKLDYGV
jgi:predicted dithiol-disulfide oxidoreductase (DUF899 family)